MYGFQRFFFRICFFLFVFVPIFYGLPVAMAGDILPVSLVNETNYQNYKKFVQEKGGDPHG